MSPDELPGTAAFADSSSNAALELAAGQRVTWIGLVANLLLAGIKFAAGIAGKSQALIADGVHSLSDLFSDVVVLFGLKWGRKAADENHHYGHARIETITTLIVGITLVVVAVGIAYSAIRAIHLHRFVKPSLLIVAVAFFSVVSKELLYHYTVKVGRRIRSLAVIGNAWHHRSDALSSVAVLLGLAGAYVNPAWQMADSFAALIVTLFILRVGIALCWRSLKEVVDTAPDTETLEEIARRAALIPGVENVHDLKARHSGSQIFVELHIVVNPEITVRAGHEIAVSVEKALLDRMRDVTRVIVHVDPEID